MINQIQKQVLILALYAGELMMKSGAEIYRVEDTVMRICKACKIPYAEVFALSTGLFVSLDQGGESDMHTYIKRIKGSSIDLDRISKINQFSRQFTSSEMTIEEGMSALKTIEKGTPYHILLRLLGAGLVSGSFCLLFEGMAIDFPCAFCIGIACYMVSVLLSWLDINFFIRGFCCSALATAAALLICQAGIGQSYGAIVIGVLMIFVPGVAITNAIRDLLTGDMISGVSRVTEAALVAVSLAAGAGVVLKLLAVLGGVFG